MKIFCRDSFSRWCIIGGSVGGTFFLIMCGARILNPFYYEWIFTGGGDRCVSFFGWIFYEKSLWKEALFGTYDTTYPYELSIVFSDSIVPFAILFKLFFASIIPEGVATQYLGIWACTCYILQGIFGGLIVKKLIKNIWIRISGIVFLCTSSTMIQRLFEHNTLVAHWVILAAFCIFVYGRELGNKKYLLWPVLMILGTSIHIYFMPMIAMIMGFDLLDDMIKNKHIVLPATAGCCSILCSLATMAILGVFSSVISKADPAEGYAVLYEYSSNLNTLFNSDGNSLFLPALSRGAREYEGYGYLGLGVLMLSAIAVFLILMDHGKKIGAVIKNNGIDFGCICGCFVLAGIIAVGPKVTFFSHILFSIPIPKSAEYIFATFRSIGRFIWIVDYIWVIMLLYVVDSLDGLKFLKRTTIPIMMTVLMLVQVVDLSPAITEKHNRHAYKAEWHSLMKENKWRKLADSHKYVYAITANMTRYSNDFVYSMMLYVYQNNLKISSSHIAHPSETLQEKSLQYMDEILEGNAKEDVIYWFENEEYMNQASRYLHTEIIDGFYVGWVQ